MREIISTEIEQVGPKLVEEFSYTGEHPDMIEFKKPWEVCIQVGQGDGKISLDGKPIESEGFSKCCALILQNKTSPESALFHIDDVDLNGAQELVLQKLSKQGRYDVTFVRGSLSRDLKKRITSSKYFSTNLDVERFLEDIEFDTGQQAWEIVYKSEEKRVYLNSQSQKKVFVFQL